MKFKKICFSTQLSDLYGQDNYQSHIEEGREYWYYFPRTDELREGWYKIKVTYIRSGCLFYIFSDYPEIKERFCPINCFMASAFIFAEIDPLKDMGNKLEDIESSKKLYRFDDEHTIVKNWPNEEIVEVDDEEIGFGLSIDDIIGKINSL